MDKDASALYTIDYVSSSISHFQLVFIKNGSTKIYKVYPLTTKINLEKMDLTKQANQI